MITHRSNEWELADEVSDYICRGLPLATDSEVEIARHIANAMKLFGGDFVSCDGEIRQYQESSGIWQKIPSSRLLTMIDSVDGSPVESGKGDKRLRMSNARTQGVFSIFCRLNDAQQPDFFADAPRGIAFRNGFATLIDGRITLVEHHEDNRARGGLPWKYDREAECRRWSSFLSDVFEGDADINEKIGALQELLGACLMGAAPSFQRCLILLGSGGNGKGVLMEVIQELFPKGSVSHVGPARWGNEYYLAKLAGKLINIVDELPKERFEDSAAFKAVVTGDTVVARSIREAPFDLHPTAGHIFAGNELPPTSDLSRGFWRRFLIVTFNRDFTANGAGQIDRGTLVRHLCEDLPGICAWALAGYERLVGNNGRYSEPESHRSAVQEWMVEADNVLAYVKDRCRVVTAENWKCDLRPLAQRAIRASRVYENYRSWCETTGRRFVSLTKFGRRMKELGFIPWEADADKRIFYGVELL